MIHAERDAAIIQMRKNGCSAKFIARQFDLSAARVYAILHAHDCVLLPRGGSRQPDRDRQIARHYAEGHSLRDLAMAYGISHQRIAAIVRRAGVERRGASGVQQHDRQLAIALYKAGEPLRAICEATGYSSPATLTESLRAAGVPPRQKRRRQVALDTQDRRPHKGATNQRGAAPPTKGE